ncbi:hypothetical protein ACS0TY_007264 [Phlomoides rotata]
MQAEDFTDFVFRVLEYDDKIIRVRFSMILWQIWKERNSKLWNGDNKSHMETIHAAATYYNEWEQAQLSRTANRNSTTLECIAWHPPPLEGRTKLLDGYPEVDVGEAIGFFEALSWLKEMDYGEVLVEGDAKIVVDAVNSNKVMNSVFGDCIHKCKSILLISPGISVVFAKRSANSLAHEFARASRRFGSSYSWVDPPDFVVGLPATLCSCNNGS